MKKINNVPEGWQETLVGEKIKILSGYAFSSKNFNLDGRGLPLVRIRDIDNNQTECFYDGSFDEEYIVKKRDILIGMDGEFNVHRWSGKRALLNQRVCKVYPLNDKEINEDYLYYLIQDPIKKIELQVGQTTVKHLSTKDLLKIKIPLPKNIAEQTAIAHVLSTVDSQIQIVERERLATERLRSGIMSRLLGGNWPVFKLETICDKIRSGGTPLTSMKEFYEGNIPFVKIEDVTNAGKYLESTQIKISSEGLEKSTAWLVPKDSILLAIYGSLGEITINKIEVATNQAILGIILDKEKADTEFVYYFFKNVKLRKYAKQSTQANLTAEIIRNLDISLPPLAEQKKIAEILRTIDYKLDLEFQRKDKLERIKRGLMDELLTGRKRVNVSKILESGK